MLSDSIVRDCAEIGKQPLSDETECQAASSQLGFSSPRVLVNSWLYAPKGCSVADVSLSSVRANYTYWNSHATGSAKNGFFAICKEIGMCSLSYCTVVYGLKYFQVIIMLSLL